MTRMLKVATLLSFVIAVFGSRQHTVEVKLSHVSVATMIICNSTVFQVCYSPNSRTFLDSCVTQLHFKSREQRLLTTEGHKNKCNVPTKPQYTVFYILSKYQS